MLQLIYRFTYLITIFGAVSIGIFILSSGWNKRLNLIWAFLQLNVIVWSLGRYMMLLSEDSTSALFWARISTLGSFFIYPSFLHAVYVFLDKKSKVIHLFYGISIGLFFINSMDIIFNTNYVVKGVRPKLSFPFYDEPNTFWVLHLITTSLCPLIAVYELVRAHKKSSRMMKNRIKFILLATAVGIVGGSTNVPLVYNVQIEPIGLPFVPIYLFLVSYAI
jgi:hypothetical protein